MKQAKVQPQLTISTPPWQWLTIALLAQMAWGVYPVLLRYLQTVSGIPSLSLLAMGNLVVLIIVGILFFRRLDKRIFRLRIVWIFGLMVVLRGLTNLLATRFTLATYTQLIYLMTPFIVALLSRAILKEQLPRHTFKALLIALVGALLIMSSNLEQAVTATIDNSRNDLLGVTFAIASSFFLALYMLVTRRTAKYNAPGEALIMVHLVSLFTFSFGLSLLFGEDWGQWQSLTRNDWIIFGFFSIAVLFGANMGQIRSIQFLGAPLVSSMMPIRLVSALIFAALLLGEQLTSPWQIAGTAVVILTITWYLRQQQESNLPISEEV